MPSRPFVPSSPVTVSLDGGLPRLKPLAQIIALLMVAGGAQASQPFSAAWFAAKGAQQSAGAARPGAQLPGMTPPPLAQQQKVNQQLQRSLQNLNNTVAAIAAQQAAQAAGRQAALAAPTDIPDGLGEGGLKVDASLPFEQAWQNAKAPVQSQADGRTTVTVEQTADRAILNWETFNIGRQTTLQFDQQSNWAVLNRVNDPSARPSQIQGQIKADGTVMVANRNGVVFSGSSQVNVRNLVAAAASISDSQFRERALLQRLAAVRGRLSLCADQAAAAKWWLSMPMASVSAEGPMPKALSTRRTSPLMPGCRHQGRACPLRRARMTSNPLIVA